MTTPDHITRIIERLNPVDREALEQYLKHKSIMGDLMCLADIRAAIGDPHGKLMQDEVVEKVKSLSQECEKLRQERDELAAHAARLLSVSGLDSDWPEVAKIINETPAISLAEVRAQAIVDFVSSEVPKMDPDNPEKLCPETHHCEYTLYRERERIHSAADRIRKDTNA